MTTRRHFRCLPRPPHPCRLLAGLLALVLTVSTVSAQVHYVRDLSGTETVDTLLPQTKAPIDTADPLYDPDLPDTQWIFSLDSLYPFQPQAGQPSWRYDLPAELKTNPYSRSTMVGIGTSEPILIVLGRARTLFIVSLTGMPNVGFHDQVALGVIHSIAALDRTNLTMIGADVGSIAGLYSVNVNTAETARSITFTSGTEPGQFSPETYHHAYGSNGLVYILDHGNNRMQVFDPADDFAYVSEFGFESGVLTANMQFAIGPTGNLYLGDGLGGGSYYSAAGDYLGAFSLDTPVDPTLSIGTPYLSADASGGVNVFDNTGFHQYLDTAAIPEPASFAWLLGASTLFYIGVRRRRT